MGYVLTLVAAREAATLTASLVDSARTAVRGAAPRWLSPGEAADIPVPVPPDLDAVRAALGAAPVDALATRARARRRRLLLADMDGTIVDGETLDSLAEAAGQGAAVAAITARSMAGEIGFAEALRRRVAMLRGLPETAIAPVLAGIRLNPGAHTLVATMRAHGARTVLVTGGFASFAAAVAAQCGFDAFRANRLLVERGALTGAVAEPILDAAGKRAALLIEARQAGVRLAEVLALGDGANDLPMLHAAGLAAGVRPKPVVAATIANRIDHAGLTAALFLQGYLRRAFVGD